MSTVIDSLERAQLRRVPCFQAGDRVRVHFQVIEGTRRRTQVFEGVVIKRQGHGARETFTVRKQSFGVGVERTFPVHSPKIEKIEVAARGDVRRAKLYYLRDRVGKRARVRERRYIGPEESVEPGLLHEPARELEADGRRRPEAVDAEADDGHRRRRRREVAATPPTAAEAAEADARRGAEPAPRPTPSAAEARRRARRAEAAGRRRAAAGRATSRRERRRQKSAGSSLLELVVIVAVALGLALGIQAFLVKPYRIPSESMVPDARGRPARARQPHRQPLQRPRGRRHRRLPPARPAPRRRRATVRRRRRRAQAVRRSRRRDKADVNFIKRVVAGPGDTICDRRRPRHPQRQARRRSRSSRTLRGRHRLRLPDADHDSRRTTGS